jgi:hypothetical protein
MMYLWVDGKGWKEFEVTDTAELEKRGISIGEGARIGNGAMICNGARPIIIYIIGSRFPVSYWGEDRVDIGCQSRSIDEWLTDYADIAEEHDFTAEDIEEYRGYVAFIKSVHGKKPAAPAGADEGGIAGV